jgi:chromosome segregation protein
MRTELGRTEDQFAALEGRVHGLEGLERERVGLAPAAARLLRERDRFGDGAILGPLSDFITASTTSAAVVERFLGMTAHAVLVRDHEAADAIRAWHAGVNPGPLLLLPLDAVPSEPTGQDGDLLPTIDVAPEAAAWTATLLARVRVLQDGGFLDPRGAVWLPGSSAGPGPLRRRAELVALRDELAAAASARSAAAAAAEVARAALGTAEASATARADAATAAVESERRAVETLDELGRRKARSDRDLEDARTLTSRLSNRSTELAARRAELDARYGEVVAAQRQGEEQAARLRLRLDDAERRAEAAREERANAQVAVAQAQARLQVSVDRALRIDDDLASANHRLENLDRELSSLDDADRELVARLAAWHTELRARSAALTEAEARLASAESAVTDADTRLTSAEHVLHVARKDAQGRVEELHRSELRYTELSGRRTAIRERLEAEWKRSLDDLFSGFEPIDMDETALRDEAEALRQQIEGLGPVNPLAIEEHDEEVKRFEFLTTQRNDLSDAKAALQQVIREIDATARELFLSTFARIRENFHRIFMTLFGGGECDLRLENPDAPLDCDIEIHASPRGKRTQRIHLLSSGERALVALSLLFGIFLTKPSPFCLLDEVDAPLDDANIGRFVRMLVEFKRSTQFIVITHNPRTTTEAADAVYGITMQEPGVSSVVSVRMRGSPVDDARLDERSPVGEESDVAESEEAVASL